MTDTTSPTDFEHLVNEAEEVELKPNTQVIEETLLAGLFTTPEAASRILADTRLTDFYFEIHRQLAKAIYPHLAQGEHVDRVTFEASLPTIDPGDKTKVEEREKLLAAFDRVFSQAQVNPPALGKVEAYLTIFTAEAKKRNARDLLTKTLEELDRADLSAEGAGAKVFEVVADLEAARRLAGAFKSEGDDWPSYFTALEARQDPTHNFLGLDTGFEHLNNVANGLMPGLFILGAAPSTGKTTFAKQLTDQVITLNAKAVGLFVSLEQSREELRVKTLSRMSGVENRDILRGRLDTKSEGWEKVRKAADEHLGHTARRVFILEGDKTTTPERIRLAALQVKRATQAEALLIVIDYLQIVPTEERYTDPRLRVDAVVSDLRRIARDLDASVFAVSSLGRAFYTSGGIESFKESGGIEFGADLGAIMKRDKDQTGTETIENIQRKWQRINLDIVKNRNGETSRLTFNFFPAVSRFVEQSKVALPENVAPNGAE